MDKISTIKKNILFFIENQDFNKKEFFAKTEISYSNFKGNSLYSEIGADKLVKILTSYPEINADWLLTGKGEMLRAGESLPSNPELDQENKALKAENKELMTKLIAAYEKLGVIEEFKSKAC